MGVSEKNHRRKLRVLVVDHFPTILECLDILLECHPTIKLAGAAVSKAEAVEKAFSICPDIIVMDLSLPDGSGTDAIREIRQRKNGAKVLVFTAYTDEVPEAIAAGAQGSVTKGSSISELIEGIQTIARGGAFFDEASWMVLQKSLRDPPVHFVDLNEQQRALGQLLIKGYSSKQIADTLSIGLRKVDKIRLELMRSAHVVNSAELAAKLAVQFTSETSTAKKSLNIPIRKNSTASPRA